MDAAVAPEISRRITQAVAGAEWWLPVNGSYWREPEGPGTDVFATKGAADRSQHPVTQVSWNDAQTFCRWRGGARLPTEAEWELAARGASDNQVFPWGNKLRTKGGPFRANIFQGQFPQHNTAADGHAFLAPVDSFGPQTDAGLYNMIGNAWEWVEDWWTVHHDEPGDEPAEDPRGPPTGTERVRKGGSFLCHKSFCYRYRNAARSKSSPDSATQNAGFRCAKSIPEEREGDKL